MADEAVKTYESPFDWDFEEQNVIIPITSGTVTEEDVNNAVSEAMSKIVLQDNGDMTYSLMVEGKEAGVINLPEDQFLKSASYNTESHKLTLEFHTSEGDTTTEIDLSDLVDAYSAGEGIKIENGVISTTFNIADYVKTSDMEEKLSAINETISSTVDEINSNLELKADKEEIADMETKTNAAATYQLKGDYITEETDPLYSAEKGNLALKTEIPTIPTNVSEFTNDAGYLTSVPEEYVTETELDAKGYLTEHQDISGKADKTYVDDELAAKQDIGDYALKSDIPTVPTKVSELENDVPYLTEHQSLEDYAKTTDVDTKLANKADTTYVDGQIASVNTALDAKATKTALEGVSAMAIENASDIDNLQSDVANKANSADVYTKEEIEDKGYLTEETDPVYSADKENIATKNEISDLTSALKTANDTILLLTSSLNLLSAKLDSKDNVEKVSYESTATDLSDTTKDYVVSGTIALETTGTVKMDGKTVALESATLSEGTRLATTGEYVAMKDTTVSGALEKSVSNSRMAVTNSETLLFENLTFDDTTSGYNAIEIGLSGTTLPKTIRFNNCKWNGTMSNNAILVFGTQDNAVIELNNCYFKSISNALRLSNKTNAKNITVNVNDCVCEKWDTDLSWAGFFICQDYTSGSVSAEQENNLFGDRKITININNLTGPNGVIATPADISELCPGGSGDQLLYVWNSNEGTVTYSSDRYPIVNIQ